MVKLGRPNTQLILKSQRYWKTAAGAAKNTGTTNSRKTAMPRIGETSRGELGMDLGIAGRKAIVCASSRGLGFACAKALAEAGCEVVINGRDQEKLTTAATEDRKSTGA